jgi:hypothetical protein
MMRREPDFDESADMRLVELQRASLGVARPETGNWNTHVALDGPPVEAEGEQPPSGALVTLDATASPDGEVIAGAVVTLALSAVNEGGAPARNVRLYVPLPGGAAFRNGSLMRDGRPMPDTLADDLFATGLMIPELAPKARTTLVWKIGVRIGNKPLVIAPSATADEAAVLGAKALMISRREGAQAAFSAAVKHYETSQAQPEELPIYELDAEEALIHEAADAALSEYKPANPPPVPTTPPPAQPEPAPPPDQPFPITEPGTPEIEPSMPEPPTEPPAVEPAAREAVLLYGRIDRPSVAYFERIFNAAKPPTLLNHFILSGALACTRTNEGGDVAGLAEHMNAQGQLLQRVVLHEKLGKKEPIAQYAGTMLAHVDRFSPAPVRDASAPEDRNALLLEAELEPPTLGVLQKMQGDEARWDFTKARQLTLALQARSIVAAAPPEAIDEAQSALRSYAQTSATQLQRFFVRMRLDRTTGLLFSSDETLDAAARRLISALSALFPS